MPVQRSVYRLIGMDGSPHPVLDTPYDSIDAAIGAANEWMSSDDINRTNGGGSIGIEVKTSNGTWRTICYSWGSIKTKDPISISSLLLLHYFATT